MKDLVVIFHEAARQRDLSRYAIAHAADIWRAEGLDVEFVFGADRFVSARASLLHVDLSLVPDEYVALARRYPVAVNAGITDVRKSIQSENLIGPTEPYDGPVIVKTIWNSGGHYERRLRSTFRRAVDRVEAWRDGRQAFPLRRKRDYQVYDRLEDVPASLRTHPELIVERFLPERTDDGGYATRNAVLLGSCMTCTRSVAFDPIVYDRTVHHSEEIEPHPKVRDVTARYHLDFGKVDYTLHEGRFVLLEVNKIVGLASGADHQVLHANRARWSRGIYDFIERAE